jgi:hypothetical protein
LIVDMAHLRSFKLSGSGRDRSAHALDKYCDLKTIWTAYR